MGSTSTASRPLYLWYMKCTHIFIDYPWDRRMQAYPRKSQSLTRGFRGASLALIVGAELNQTGLGCDQSFGPVLVHGCVGGTCSQRMYANGAPRPVGGPSKVPPR